MTTHSYPIPAAAARAELRVVNSRFIGSSGYTPSVEQAKAFIAHIRQEFPDATHHAYAYVVGFGSSVVAGMSDAGEPSGTAGRPILSIVRGSGLGDLTIVVSRFFGGTLLGTGGLVHAYGDTTRAVLDVTPRTDRVETCVVHVRVQYSLYTLIRHTLESFEATITSEEFAADVTVVAILPVRLYDACVATMSGVSSGQAVVRQA